MQVSFLSKLSKKGCLIKETTPGKLILIMFYKTFKRTAIRCIYHMVSKNIEKRTLIPAEAISKFRELTAARMSAIGQQLFQMKKNPRTPAQPESLYLGYPRI